MSYLGLSACVPDPAAALCSKVVAATYLVAPFMCMNPAVNSDVSVAVPTDGIKPSLLTPLVKNFRNHVLNDSELYTRSPRMLLKNKACFAISLASLSCYVYSVNVLYVYRLAPIVVSKRHVYVFITKTTDYCSH